MADLLEQLKLYIAPFKVWEENEEQQLSLLLRFSSDEILNCAFPFGTALTEVPKKYEGLCIRAAAELYAKMGAEGQTGHNENGISRTWASATLLPLMQTQIIPSAGVIRGSLANENP